MRSSSDDANAPSPPLFLLEVCNRMSLDPYLTFLVSARQLYCCRLVPHRLLCALSPCFPASSLLFVLPLPCRFSPPHCVDKALSQNEVHGPSPNPLGHSVLYDTGTKKRRQQFYRHPWSVHGLRPARLKPHVRAHDREVRRAISSRPGANRGERERAK